MVPPVSALSAPALLMCSALPASVWELEIQTQVGEVASQALLPYSQFLLFWTSAVQEEISAWKEPCSVTLKCVAPMIEKLGLLF